MLEAQSLPSGLGGYREQRKKQIIPSMEKYYRKHKEKQSSMIAGKQENTFSAFLLPLPPSLLFFLSLLPYLTFLSFSFVYFVKIFKIFV